MNGNKEITVNKVDPEAEELKRLNKLTEENRDRHMAAEAEAQKRQLIHQVLFWALSLFGVYLLCLAGLVAWVLLYCAAAGYALIAAFFLGSRWERWFGGAHR